MAPLRSCEFMSEVPNVSSLHSLGRCIASICFYVIVYVFSYWLADFGKLAIRHFWGIMSCGRNNFHKCAHFIVGMIISTLHFFFQWRRENLGGSSGWSDGCCSASFLQYYSFFVSIFQIWNGFPLYMNNISLLKSKVSFGLAS